MKTQILEGAFVYDGSQLRSLWAYQQSGLVGDVVISFVGPCRVATQWMKDAEDLKAGEKIEGSEMLHFIFEIFDRPLLCGVVLQRIFATLLRDFVFRKTGLFLEREGDDLYLGTGNMRKKLSISIACPSVRSVLVHFAVNVRNEGTPVPTCSLQDLGLRAQDLQAPLLAEVAMEWQSCQEASWKAFSAS